MKAIDAAFLRLRKAGEKGLVVYLTAGDPDSPASLDYFKAAADAGADILEVGVPFSDPTADGPTIEAAARRALDGGMNVSGALDLVRRLRKTHATPVVLFGYYNPFLRYGQKSLWRDALAAGVDGFLIVDLPFEEAGGAVSEMREKGLSWIPLAAPTSGLDRIRAIRPRRFRLHVPHLGHRRDGRPGNAAAGDAVVVEGSEIRRPASPGRGVRHFDPRDGPRGDAPRRRRGGGKRLREDRGTERQVPPRPRGAFQVRPVPQIRPEVTMIWRFDCSGRRTKATRR